MLSSLTRSLLFSFIFLFCDLIRGFLEGFPRVSPFFLLGLLFLRHFLDLVKSGEAGMARVMNQLDV
ncbi:Uncharacterized protein TCM_022671 [Theobroma cacao]|uniref:Uncharacterized protein n=1 Tax=Theobroma cacao TaxID=3641 RepID=A0A061EUK2_THECC|nr:Uncharacterized protein TCM_022671 [Theobroma cacao]